MSIELTGPKPVSVEIDNLQTQPSATPNVQTVTSITENGTIVKVELWDFPGSVVTQRGGPLVSNFFHAAIICFSVADAANVKAIKETVS